MTNTVDALQRKMQSQKVDWMFVTPSPNFRYLTGYKALPLERLTMLMIPAVGVPTLIVPRLEFVSAKEHVKIDCEIISFTETENPIERVANIASGVVAVDPYMWSEKLLKFIDHMKGASFIDATSIINVVRTVKSESEQKSIMEAGKAIDWVHEKVTALKFEGRTEKEIGEDIKSLIFESGHETVDFIIVASGPNSASPHHEVSDRVVQPGDVVVVDIGGTMPSGYCSDCTRTYAVSTVDAEFEVHYQALLRAQTEAVNGALVGTSCEDVDSIARNILEEANLGAYFIHRTGHGIGLQTHEDPYIVQGNTHRLVEGNAFSIEPGFYIEGKFGARIEDIVISTNGGPINCNNRPREIIIVN
ncbi:MAG: M24 family metallopeptidase [Candidatus Nanopelagicales bacterium]